MRSSIKGHVDVRTLFGTFKQRELDLSCDQGREHLAAVAATGSDAYLRTPLQKSGDEAWKEVLGDGLQGADTQLAHFVTIGLCNGREGLVTQHLDSLCKRQQGKTP